MTSLTATERELRAIAKVAAQAVWTTVAIIFDWCTTKNIHSVVQSVGFSRFGSFVKMVLRVSSLLDEWCDVLLGIEDFGMFNRLEGYNERLFDGIVSPKSLYVDVS